MDWRRYCVTQGDKVKAIVYTRYGPPDVLHLEEVKKPALNEEKVLVKVYAASINAGDWHLLTTDTLPNASDGRWAVQTQKHNPRR